MKEGIAGKIAGGFLQSKLSLLLMVAFVLVGAYSVYLIPREEEPQINLPVADIFIGMPGATPTEMETKVVAPLEKTLSNINGVEHVVSTSMADQAMLTVQFYVGQDFEKSLVNLYNELMKNMDKMPQGVSMPLIKTRSINDVPVLALTLWSKDNSDYTLRQQAELIRNEVKKIQHVTNVDIIGGRSRQVTVKIDKEKLAGVNLDMASIGQYMQAANFQMQAGNIYSGNETFAVTSGNFLQTREDVEKLVVGMNKGYPVYLSSIATITEGPATSPTQYVSFAYGKEADDELKKASPSDYPAVTLAISKQEGTDAMHLSEKILSKVEHLKKESISPDIQITVTRNYGESASEKVSELLIHLVGAIVAVTLFVMLAMGWRGGLVVFLSVPITFALTLFAYYFMDYTLNRITLFALVFVTGIVVDDSIIIAENMHRHFKMKYLSFRQAALYAINEVGNPTILATFTVVASVLPMAFVSGLMGPYMSPMPIGASIAMMFSLIVALTLTPYLGYIFLKHKDDKQQESKKETEPEDYDITQTRLYKFYAWSMRPMLASRRKRWVFMLTTLVLLIASVSLFFLKVVPVKMLPFDNKNEFQVVIDMPETATLEETAAVTKEIAAFVSTQDEVLNCQTYVGTSAPISFNGLMRHYDLRKGENVADIQVNLTDKGDRSAQSHDIAKKMRKPIQEIAKRWGANAKVVEVPPGPPVLSTIVAEIYGPDYQEQIRVARQIKAIFDQTEGMVDTDVFIEDDQTEIRFDVDKEKAMLRGVAPAKITENLRAAVSGKNVGVLHKENTLSPIPIQLELNNADKFSVEALKSLPVQNMHGQVVSLGDVTQVKEVIKEKSIWRKDQKRVVMVAADLAGSLESPIYAMMDVNKKLEEIKLPSGYDLTVLNSSQPETEDNYSMKWDGEWQITYEVFRDLGIAFAVALIIIYLLIVGWFQSFMVPVVMLTAIPLSLIGIVVGHWVMGAYFSATSMIGFIALAGVMVRNSVLLIDFIDIRLKEGIPLTEAVIEAGAVRTLPIVLTAGTVVLGAIVILFDPLFQGLAISLMGGTITSTVLTLVVVPLLYYKMLRNKIK